MTASVALADWAHSLDGAEENLQAVVRMRMIDYLANLLGGSRRLSVDIATGHASALGPGAVPLPDGSSAIALHAALPYGAAAHSLEFDDTHQPSSSHPGAVIFSTALPLAHEIGATWDDTVSAVVAGYEVMCRIGVASQPQNEYDRGFHPTGTCGVFGAATAATLLFGGDASDIVNAIGIAGSMSSGSMAFLDDGTWTKHLHPGWAAHSGMTAARLALAGYLGPPTILDGVNGYLVARASSGRAAEITRDLGSAPLAIEETSMKAHGCCRYEQSSIDALLALRSEHALTADDIEAVRIGVLAAGWEIVAEPTDQKRRPASVVDSQFSMPFGAALALTRGSASIADHSTESLTAPEVIQMMDRVTCHRDPELDAQFPERWPAAVEIDTRDGRTLRHTVEFPKGDPENPFSREELEDRVIELRGDYPLEAARALVDAANNVASQGLKSVFAALSGLWGRVERQEER